MTQKIYFHSIFVSFDADDTLSADTPCIHTILNTSSHLARAQRIVEAIRFRAACQVCFTRLYYLQSTWTKIWFDNKVQSDLFFYMWWWRVTFHALTSALLLSRNPTIDAQMSNRSVLPFPCTWGNSRFMSLHKSMPSSANCGSRFLTIIPKELFAFSKHFLSFPLVLFTWNRPTPKRVIPVKNNSKSQNILQDISTNVKAIS